MECENCQENYNKVMEMLRDMFEIVSSSESRLECTKNELIKMKFINNKFNEIVSRMENIENEVESVKNRNEMIEKNAAKKLVA